MAKPSGVPVIPGRSAPTASTADSGPCLRAALEAVRGPVFVVHRIDQDASGVVLFAKDRKTHRDLCLQFERRRTRKTYLAAVQGVVAGDGSVDRPIREFGSGRMGIAQGGYSLPGGKSALTRYRVLERFAAATLLEVEPVTGRRHQIRVHLYAAGHPILGDALYGKDRPVGGAPRLMLHGLEIGFFGADGEAKKVKCEPPEDFARVLLLLST
ncbi:MAG: RNA pseudouridine synthase [Elusimicrobia bacterium]|nr:RNA pseudouridine synthase [Elusimicrobiota bacterium]